VGCCGGRHHCRLYT
jgi:Uncharacterized conserved protein